jgi:hypothetical protein
VDRRSAGKASDLLRWIDAAPAIDRLVQRLARAGLHTAVFTADDLYVGLER